MIRLFLTLFRMGIFRAAYGWRRSKRSPLPKICHTYPTMMKVGAVIPYLKKIQKMYESSAHPLISSDISIFAPKIRKFCYINKYRYRFHFKTWFLILLAFLEFSKTFLINLVIILMMSAKMTTPGLLKITVFSY